MYGCVRFVLGALQVSDAAEAAAEAFRALCVHGRRQLARAETIPRPRDRVQARVLDGHDDATRRAMTALLGAFMLPARAYVVSLASLLAGASVVHAIFKPDLTIPVAADEDARRASSSSSTRA